jgi:hypothetical protein
LAELPLPVTEFENNPQVWMELFLVRLAGELRLPEAAGLVVDKFHEEEAELLWEECMWALPRLGRDEVAALVLEGFAASSDDYRNYASSVLADLPCDTTVRGVLELLPGEPDLTTKTTLAAALLQAFAFDAIEPVRQMILDDDYDADMLDLREDLVGACLVMDVRVPELDEWKREVHREVKERRQRMREMEDEGFEDPEDLEDFEDLPPLKHEADSWVDRPVEDRLPVQHPFINVEKKVGRNDPCPCGSGKKFKKCCMNK